MFPIHSCLSQELSTWSFKNGQRGYWAALRRSSNELESEGMKKKKHRERKKKNKERQKRRKKKGKKKKKEKMDKKEV